jgi:hypothetical protein
MKTNLQACAAAWSYSGIRQFLLSFFILWSAAFATDLQAQSCAGRFSVGVTRTYNSGTNSTAFVFQVTKLSAGNALSHWSFPVELCEGEQQSVSNFLASATKETSLNGTSWTAASTSYGIDPSSSACYSGVVLKWNVGMGNETIRYYRLVFPGNVEFIIPLAILKYGNTCCVLNNVYFGTSQLSITCPSDRTEEACQSQSDIDAAFSAWLGDVEYSGGTLSTSPEYPAAPSHCGGSVSVTFTVNGCGTSSCSATFAVTPAPAVMLTAPADETLDACLSQSEVNDAFTNWLAGVQYSGGCNLEVSNGNPSAPSFCGGEVLVTWTADSDCEAQKTASATFAVTPAPAVVLTAPADETLEACLSQYEVNAAFASWMSGVQYSGGCNLHVSDGGPSAPYSCGGDVIVTWTADSDCEAQMTASATFAVTPAPAVSLICPAPVVLPEGLTQDEVDAAFAEWLSEAEYSGGCNLEVSNGNPSSPSFCGGEVTVTWTATSDCEDQVTCSSSFEVPYQDNLTLTCPSDWTEESCQSQSAVNAAFSTWLASVQYGGGVLSTYPANPAAPDACGGSVEVTFYVSGACDEIECSATFSVNYAPAVTLTCPESLTLEAGLTDEQIASAYSAWLASASATGGCNLQLTNNSTGAPGCGVTVTVTFTASSSCEDDVTCSSTFSVPDCGPEYQGCTPGFWRNNFAAWGCGYTSNTNFFSVFSVVTNRRGLSVNLKLGQAVALEGGEFRALARHAVAAILNACDNGVNYPYSQSEIIAAVVQMFNTNGAVMLGGSTYTGAEALKNALAMANEMGCPLNSSDYRSGVSETNEGSDAAGELIVGAYPNPFNEVVRFRIESDTPGAARLEIVNTLGQRLDIVNIGVLESNQVQVVEYRPEPGKMTHIMYYILTVGDKQVTGKLMQDVR